MKNKILIILLFVLSVSFTPLFAQTVTVKGRVIDPQGQGLPGVSVIIKGTKTGTMTDIDGNYSITAPSSKSIVAFSFIGCNPQELSANNKNLSVITMTDDLKQLDEVIVVGYGTQKKENLTGAIKMVDAKVIESRPITSAVSGLQGVVGGLNITNDNGGAPGAKMDINIRGMGTVGSGSNSSPLVLIDGVEGDLSVLNPNDIESFSVLKDAGSAAIYGSRAPFGVILVTTKTGSKGNAPTVKYSGNVRINTPLHLPKMTDSYTHAIMSNDAKRNAGGGLVFGGGQLDYILAYQQGRELYDNEGKPLNIGWGTKAREGAIVSEWEWESGTWANVDWYDTWVKKASYSQEHNISLTGGTEKLSYYVSGRYYEQPGMFNFVKEDYNTLNINGNFNFTVNKYITFNWNTRFINETNDKPSAMDDLFFHNLSKLFPTTPVTMPNGDYNYYSNIPSMRDGGQQISKNQTIVNQFKIKIEPIKDWNIYADASWKIENKNYTRQFKQLQEVLPDGTTRRVSVTKGMGGSPYKVDEWGNFMVYPAAEDTWFEEHNGRTNYYNISLRSDYELKTDKHYFKALLGSQIEYFYTNRLKMGSTGVLVDDSPFIPQNSKDFLRVQNIGEWSNLGFFGRVNYVFDGRYLAEINLRGDAASRFPSNQRWGLFPSFSVGWNIAEEAFFAPIKEKAVDMFKLRASYGSLGNQNMTSMYPYFQRISLSDPGYVIGGNKVEGINAPQPFSEFITWETVQTIDAGFDLVFLSNRLLATFDWYQRKNKNMVGPSLALPGIYGASVPRSNNAELTTNGWEVELTWRDRIGKDWSYDVTFSLSDNLSTVSKYYSPTGSLKSADNDYYKGKVLGEIWGYQVEGIAKSDAEMTEWSKTHNAEALGTKLGGGDFMYKDLNGDKNINGGAMTIADHGDLSVIGNMTPRFQYGLRAGLAWKGIDFSMFWQGIGKRDLYIEASTFDGIGDEYNRPTTTEHLDYFRYADHPFGANFDAYYARPRTDHYNNHTNDYYLQDASYLRLKNVTIGYTLPKIAGFSKVVKNLRVYVSGENLLTFTKLRIFDPEAIGLSTATWGIGKSYPMFQTFSFGLSLTL